MIKLLLKLICYMTYIMLYISWVIVINIIDFIICFIAGLIIGYTEEKNKQAALNQLDEDIQVIEADIKRLQDRQKECQIIAITCTEKLYDLKKQGY